MNHPSLNRREFLTLAASASLSLHALDDAFAASPETNETRAAGTASSLPPRSWVKQGIVAASNTLAPSFVRRRGGERKDYAEQWRADLGDATVRTLLDQGVNLIIVSFYKGAGLKTEAQDIAVAREFVATAHRRGLRVGGYVGASLLYETLEAEVPESKDWKQVDEFGRPIYYTPDQTFRYMACRNNPGYLSHIKEALKLAIQDLKMDMIHFDQLMWWSAPSSCHCRHCRTQFQEFLRKRYPAALALRRFGFEDVSLLNIPPFGNISPLAFSEVTNPLMQEWALFRASSLAERYKELTDYIYHLNPETAVQGNPTMNLDKNVGFLYGVDYGQLLDAGDMIYSEEPNQPLWTDDGHLVSRIRTYKGARSMGKPVWFWQVPVVGDESISTRKGALALRLSEALAFNDRNLGAVAGLDVGSNVIPGEAQPYIELFHKRTNDLVNTKTVADVAILRSYASTAFDPSHSNVSTILFEQLLIQARIPFAIIFDRHLENLSRYKVLVLADQDALSDQQVANIRDFVKSGGGVVATGRTSLLDEWRLVRPMFGLADVFGVDYPPTHGETTTPLRKEVGMGRSVYISHVEPATEIPSPQIAYAFSNKYWHLPKNHSELVASIHWAARYHLSAEVNAPSWVTIELAQQGSNSLLLHLVNYKPEESVTNILATVRPPTGFHINECILVTPEHVIGNKLAFTIERDGVSIIIPHMRVYALVIMTLEGS